MKKRKKAVSLEWNGIWQVDMMYMAFSANLEMLLRMNDADKAKDWSSWMAHWK